MNEARDTALTALDTFKSDLAERFICLCNGNDGSKLTLLKIYDTIDEIYGEHVHKWLDVGTVDSAPVPFIKSQDSVDAVRVVHSSWDYGEGEPEPDEDNNVQAYCKNCGAGDVHAVRKINKVPYCWKCGAKMKEA